MTVMPDRESIRPAELRRTLSCFPTGVAIVTTRTLEGAPIGLAVSSFNSVSMDPPLVLWSLARNSVNLPVFRASDGFVINVLSADQAELAKVFSSPVEDRFQDVEWNPGFSGHPVLAGTAALLECRTYARYDGGDHEIMLGEVLRHKSTELTPLVFGKGRIAPLVIDA